MSVTYSVAAHVATISFDDGKANVIGHDVLTDLADALDQARADGDVGAVLMVGRPGRFSAGFDLATMTSSPSAMQDLVVEGGRFVGRLLLEPLPVVVACTGHALAAGALILLAADHRIGASGDYKIGLNEVAIGMTLPTWAVELARYRMPPSTLDQIVVGQVNSPEAAVAAGFLDRVVAPDEVVATASELAGQLSALRRGAVAGTKMRLRDAVAHRMLDGIDADLAGLAGAAPGPGL
jgi:enoyl-CoA hydratase